MAHLDDGKTVLRNMLLGRWAAEKLGLTGADAQTYSDELASGAFDPERGDVYKKVREDFDSAGVKQSDEQILSMMTELMIKAGSHMPSKQGNSFDGAAMKIKRNLTSR